MCILSSNAFGHFGLGKCKLVILRCRFHCKNAGFEDLTTGILHFLVPTDHQLTFSKSKMSNGIPGKNAQKNLQPRIPWEAVL